MYLEVDYEGNCSEQTTRWWYAANVNRHTAGDIKMSLRYLRCPCEVYEEFKICHLRMQLLHEADEEKWLKICVFRILPMYKYIAQEYFSCLQKNIHRAQLQLQLSYFETLLDFNVINYSFFRNKNETNPDEDIPRLITIAKFYPRLVIR